MELMFMIKFDAKHCTYYDDQYSSAFSAFREYDWLQRYQRENMNSFPQNLAEIQRRKR